MRAVAVGCERVDAAVAARAARHLAGEATRRAAARRAPDLPRRSAAGARGTAAGWRGPPVKERSTCQRRPRVVNSSSSMAGLAGGDGRAGWDVWQYRACAPTAGQEVGAMRRVLLGGCGRRLGPRDRRRGVGAGAGGGDGRRRSGRGQRRVDRAGRHASLHGLHELLLVRRAARARCGRSCEELGVRPGFKVTARNCAKRRDRSGRRPCGSSPHCRSRPRRRCSRNSRATPRSASSWPGAGQVPGEATAQFPARPKRVEFRSGGNELPEGRRLRAHGADARPRVRSAGRQGGRIGPPLRAAPGLDRRDPHDGRGARAGADPERDSGS